MANVTYTWLGHGGYRFESAQGKRIYIDPWLDNPKFPEGERDLERVDILVLTHGHDDHIANAVDICKQYSPKVVAIFDLGGWLESQGGTVDVDGIKFTMTHALHSSGFGDVPTYLGDAAGYVIEFENGLKVYCAGDTDVFGDMQLIGRLYAPDVAVLPIGDHFTMGPKQAALALELLGTKRCIPVHWGTFGLLTGTPDALRAEASGVEILDPEPGQTIEL